MVKGQIERLLHDMDVARREEVEVLRDMVVAAREESEQLAIRVKALEAQLDAITVRNVEIDVETRQASSITRVTPISIAPWVVPNKSKSNIVRR